MIARSHASRSDRLRDLRACRCSPPPAGWLPTVCDRHTRTCLSLSQRHGRPSQVGSQASMTRWVYDFADGSREMRELLGGKGANVAEMTRVLGADRVPAGFTITTEACVAYMDADRQEPDEMAEQVAAGARAPRGAAGQDARRSRGPAARVGALRCARVDAGDARHGAQPRAQRRVGAGPGEGDRATSASPGTPTGASCRCSATSRAGSPARSSRTRSRRPSAARGVS